jgi:MFS family permease
MNMRSILIFCLLIETLALDRSERRGIRGGAGDMVAFLEQSASEKSSGLQSWISEIPFNMYTITLVPLGLVTLVLAWMTRPKTDENLTPQFKSFMWRYLIVWYIAVAADWLQGPYVYALYAAYGFPGHQIAQLFVAGFGASMVFGTLVGSLADTWGRKRCAVLYCLLYIASCFTKHSSNYWILMVGRVTGGIATSILFSCFETWMVSEHMMRHNFSGGLLRYMFTMMFFGMYAVAIASGITAQLFVDALPMKEVNGMPNVFWGGYTFPFDMAIVCLVACMFMILFTWDENRGSGALGANHSLVSSLCKAFASVMSQWRIALMGVVVTAFEGSMFAFVFNWTPALDSKTLPPPHGLIFAMFMMACICGSSTCSLLGNKFSPATVLFWNMLLGTCSLGLVAIAIGIGSTYALQASFFCFLVFEFCVGLYWPTVGTLKSEIVPEDVRATVYNIYRVPLNAVVCALLLSNISLTASFGFCTALLLLSVVSICPIMGAGGGVKGK